MTCHITVTRRIDRNSISLLLRASSGALRPKDIAAAVVFGDENVIEAALVGEDNIKVDPIVKTTRREF